MSVSPSETDEKYLRRAIRLAMNGRGRVEPNPMVGCVVVKNDRVIGEGYHQQFGGPHAEPTALANCRESPAGATAYVTLEPCCHTSKKTPPCTPRLIEAKIARAVIGCLDPNPDVNGNGVRQLRDAGIHVDGPLLEGEAKQLIAPFLARVTSNRPYVTLKWAESSDGKVAGPGGRRRQISNPTSMATVHKLRAHCDAIAVGINTVLSDDPMLTSRDVASARAVRRLVLDSKLRIPLTSKLVATARDYQTRSFCWPASASSDKATELRARGVEVIDLDPIGLTKQNDDPRLSLTELLLCEEGTHLLVEPGPQLAKGFFDQNAVDRLWVFRSSELIGDSSAPSAATIPPGFIATGELKLGGDVLTEYLNPNSAAFFSNVPSADFVLAEDATHTRASS